MLTNADERFKAPRWRANRRREHVIRTPWRGGIRDHGGNRKGKRRDNGSDERVRRERRCQRADMPDHPRSSSNGLRTKKITTNPVTNQPQSHGHVLRMTPLPMPMIEELLSNCVVTSKASGNACLATPSVPSPLLDIQSRLSSIVRAVSSMHE